MTTTPPPSPGPNATGSNAHRPSPRTGASSALAIGVALAVLALQAVVLYVPRAPDTSGTPLPPWFDLVVHVGVFAAATATCLWAFGRHAGAVLALNAVHAPASELLQHYFLPQRTGDVRDLIADLVGVALGAGAWWALRRGAGRRTHA